MRERMEILWRLLSNDGSLWISIDDDENEAFYRKHGVTAGDILNGSVTTNDDAARRFLTAVNTSTRGEQSASAAPTPGAAAAPAAPAAPPKPRPLSSGAQSFPLEDSQPGREPASTPK